MEKDKRNTNSLQGLDQEVVNRKYFALYPRYARLGANIVEALSFFLEEERLATVSITYRVKGIDRFREKIQRKKYEKPFEQMNDICGARLICHFQSDIAKIKEVIKREFVVFESKQKEKQLGPTEFGYRSYHYVVGIKKSWTNAPNYRGLEDLKAEIQVRTILMHAWAEIEHKLAYKKDVHIPDELRRKFSLLSAKLEEADEQFEELATLIKSSKQSLIDEAKKQREFSRNVGLNLDSLQAFLDYYFPDKQRNIRKTRDLLDEMIKHNITIGQLVDAYDQVSQESALGGTLKKEDGYATQPNAAEYLLKKAKKEDSVS